MRLSEGVEWGLHCAAVLAYVPEGKGLPATKLAEYHGVPGAYLAKSLQSLSRAAIVEAVPGRNGGYRLARPASGVTVLDVVEALDGAQPAFRCTEIRRRAPFRVPTSDFRIPCSIHAVMDRADAAWRSELRSVSINDILEMFVEHVSPETLVQGANWIEEALQ